MNRFNVPLNLICPLSTTSKHILREPRKLPCRKTACFECIKALVKGPKNEFQCSFCLKIHSLQALETNRMFEIQMDDDLANLASYESNRLELARSNTRELFATSQNALDGLFEFYKFEMEIRLEVLKADIDMKAEEVGRNIDLSLAKSWDDIKNCFQKDDFEWDGKDLQKSEDLLQRLRIIGMIKICDRHLYGSLLIIRSIQIKMKLCVLLIVYFKCPRLHQLDKMC